MKMRPSCALRLHASSSGVALFLCGVLLVIDVYLYRSGLSWTPIHYESLTPLLIMGAPGRRPTVLSAIAAALLFGTLEVLFFSFGLTFRLAAESWLFLLGAGVLTLAWLAPALIQGWRARWLPWSFVAIAMGILIVDKSFSRDVLASSYLPHFFKMGADARASASGNAVYAALDKQLKPTHGGILIVFEALGVPVDKSVVEALTREFSDFQIETLPFEGGSTVPAEIRYLCGINGTITDFSSCIPLRLQSHAMHGNALSYFSRAQLYRSMGFSSLAGKHELADLATCRYSYVAVCDAALWDRLATDVRTSKCSDFHYVLSIDAHFPYAKYERHVEGLYADLRTLMLKLRALSLDVPGCPMMVAGDHPPPLAQGFNPQQVLLVAKRQ